MEDGRFLNELYKLPKNRFKTGKQRIGYFDYYKILEYFFEDVCFYHVSSLVAGDFG